MICRTSHWQQQGSHKTIRNVFFGLRNFLIYLDLEKFHALQNLENKWKLWTLKKFKEALDLENF